MTPDDARALIERGVHEPGGSWADLGAGTGTFTVALASVLGPLGTVYAVERDRAALRALRSIADGIAAGARIEVVNGDFTRELDLPPLAGILAANALHFVPRSEQAGVLARLAALLDANGRILLVEYDRDRGNPYVPYPISRERLRRLAKDAGFGPPSLLAERPSDYGGELYSAVLVPSA
ncbi:MAG TPA: class I SAM-dependent methyltransferase [Thermoanaerobaculia bacterium]